MASREQHITVGGLVLGVAALAWLASKGKTSTPVFGDRAFSQEYSPYQHFLHQSPAGWVRHFPASVAPGCLPMPYQTQDAGWAVRAPEVSSDYADSACAQ